MEDVKQQIFPSDLLIEVETGNYPVTLDYIRNKFNDRSFARYPYLDDLKTIGYDIVKQTGKPVGDVLTETPPKLIDGVYYRQWEVRSFNDAELEENLLNAKRLATESLEVLRSNELNKGCIITVDETIFTLPLTQTSINSLLAKKVMGVTTSNSFWTLENTLVTLDKDQSNEVIDEAIKHHIGVMDGIDQLINKVWGATKVSEIPATFTL